MKNFCTLFLWAVALLGGLAGCQKTSEAPREPISCTYQVLNSKGEETSVFTPGQDIFFRYSITNHTGQAMQLKETPYDGNRFMEVFSLAGGQAQLLGKPYATIAQLYIGESTVAPHETVTYTFSWLESVPSPDAPYYTPATNRPLPTGFYRTSMLPQLTWHYAYEATTTVPLAAQDFVRQFEVR